MYGYVRERHFIKMSENIIHFFMEPNNLTQIALQYKNRVLKTGQEARYMAQVELPLHQSYDIMF